MPELPAERFGVEVVSAREEPIRTAQELAEAGPDVFVPMAIKVMQHVRATGHRGATNVGVLQVWALVMTLDAILEGIAVREDGATGDAPVVPE